MHRRYRRRVRIEQLGAHREADLRRAALILAVPILSLLLPALAVVIADTGGTSAPVRISADIERFLLFYSGVFALVALTAAVGAGLLASDRIVMSPERRIMSQGLHRMISLVGMSALANHIMLEILAHRVTVIDGFVPFLAARRTFFMGLGTLASDLFVVIIITGIMRARFTAGGRRWLWRALHAVAYAAWPLAILHGLLAGRSAKPYVDWSYGGCLALVALALILRIVMRSRGRNSAEGLPERVSAPLPPQPRGAQVFTSLPPAGAARRPPQGVAPGRYAWPDGRGTAAPLPALPPGQSARAPRPGRPAPPRRRPPAGPSAWPLPDYDPDWPEWLATGQPDGQER
jgi:hypothetical protein